MSSIAATISQNLKTAMVDCGLNQMQLAEKSGLKHPVISRALNEKMHNPEFKTIAALAAATRRQPWELICPAGAEPSESPVPKIKREFIQELLDLDDATAAAAIPGFRGLIDAFRRLQGKQDGQKVQKG